MTKHVGRDHDDEPSDRHVGDMPRTTTAIREFARQVANLMIEGAFATQPGYSV